MSFLASLAAGYGADEILDFVVTSFPNIGKRIRDAKKFGHDAKEIVKMFDGFDEKKLKKKDQQLAQEGDFGINPLIQAQRQTLESSGQTQIAKGAQTGLKLAGTALGTYALSRALPALLGPKSAHGIDEVAAQTVPGSAEAIEIPPSQEAGIPETPIKAENIPQQVPNEQLWGMFQKESATKIDPSTDAFLKIAKKMRTTGEIMNKEDFDRFKTVYDSKISEGKNIPLALKEASNEFSFSKTQPIPAKKSDNIIAFPSTTPSNFKNESVGNLALTPQGDIGEVESVKNGIATIKIGDKTKTRKEEELQSVPISKTDLADLYEQLIQAIPEGARSSVINYAGYDADANELLFRPHNGAAYVYKNIPPEFADKIKNAMFKAKTTGDNFYGSWESGEGSRFAGLSQLIRDLQKQYGGKGKEYVRKYQTLVDILGEPEKAKKEKHKTTMEAKKKEKDEERRRKKQSS